MGKIDKKAAATSSRAAELLAKSGTGGTGSGFGGFSGNAPVTAGGFAFGAKYISKVSSTPTEELTPSSTGPSAIIPAELDGELSQQLQRITKRDATTRVKALQTLRSLVSEKSEEDVKLVLSPWAYSFGRLVMDTNRTVRAEACLAMGAIATAAGRNIAPFIKFVYPYWLLAQHDVANEVVSAATSSLQATFPGTKAADVFLFCRTEVLKLLSDNSTSTPQSLGDARKESAEELQSRHECVLSATCALLGTIIKQSTQALTTTPVDSTSPTDSTQFEKQVEAHNEILTGSKALLNNSSFLKMTLQSKSPLVRRSAYNLIASICRTAPKMLSDDATTLALFTPVVFGCLGDKESANHPAMWDMVLSFASSSNSNSSSSWCSHVNLNKAVLPKLWSMLRHGCYGSAEGSYPAVLPFIDLIVQAEKQNNALESSSSSPSFGYNSFESLLSAVWDGCLSLPIGSAAQEAAATCFAECYLYAIIKAEQFEGDTSGVETFCKNLTAAAIETKCLVEAVGGPFSTVSRSILTRIISKLSKYAQNNTSSHWKVDILVTSIGAAVAEATHRALENLNSADAPSLSAIEELLLEINSNAIDSEKNQEIVALSVARPVVAALLPYLHNTSTGDASAGTAAAALLASLVKNMPDLNITSTTEHGVDDMHLDQTSSFTVESILHRIIEEQQTGAALEASCDLIISCLLQLDYDTYPSQLVDCLKQLKESVSTAAAITFLTRFTSSATEEDLWNAESAALSTFGYKNITDTDPESIALGTMLLLGNGTTATFVNEISQERILDTLASRLNNVSSVDGGDAASDEASESALEIIQRITFSQVLSRMSRHVVESRLRVLSAVYRVLVEEACAAATLVEEEKEYQRTTTAGVEDTEMVDEPHHSRLYSLAYGVWSVPSNIGYILDLRMDLAVSEYFEDGSIPQDFIEWIVSSIHESLETFAMHDSKHMGEGELLGGSGTCAKACLAAATCTKMALDAFIKSDSEHARVFLINLENEISRFSCYPVFFMSLGDVLGWKDFLNIISDENEERTEEDEEEGSEDDEEESTEEDYERISCSALISKVLRSNDVEVPLTLIEALFERPNVLAKVLRSLSNVVTESKESTFSQLLCAALSSSNDEAVTTATSIFRTHIVAKTITSIDSNTGVPGNVLSVLLAVAPILRSSEELLSASELSKLAFILCEEAIVEEEEDDGDDSYKTAAAACFPAPFVAPPVPRWAPTDSSSSSSTFGVGDLVWYKHRDGSWEASAIVSIDVSVEPPSFAVKIATGVRETEKGRLIARNENDPQPRTNSVQHRDDNGAIGSSSIVPLYCGDDEKHLLLELFRSCFNTTTKNDEADVEQEAPSLPGSSTSPDIAIVCSALAWCCSEFTQADWEVALKALQTGMEAAALGAAAAAVSVATVVSTEAEKVAGAALGGPEPSLAFFRQLHHKKILETSVKGAAAGHAIAASVSSSLENFYNEKGSSLGSLLQSYCTASKLIATTARTCPFMTWESSQAAVCAAVLDIFIFLGKIVALAGGCGQSAALLTLSSGKGSSSSSMYGCWNELSHVVDATVAAADRAFLAVVVERAGARRSEDGVGCTEALVALSLDPNAPESAQNAAYRSILLHSELVLDIVRTAGVVGDDDDDATAATLLETSIVRKDWYEGLESGGLLPEIATAASDPQHPSFTTAWGFIVSFLLYSPDSSTARTQLVERIKEAHGMVHAVLDTVLPLLPLSAISGGGTPSGSRRSLGNTSSAAAVEVFGAEDTSAEGFSNRLCALGVPTSTSANDSTSAAHAALLYAGMLRALPVLCRLWYGDLRDRSTLAALEKYTSTAVSAGLLAAEYSAVDHMVAGLDRFEKFSVRANSASREVVASMEVEDGHMIELVIKLPASMPLKAPEAECRRSVGVSEARLRKWLLSITAFLRNRNGAIADALRLWKRNVDTEFEGHDDCLICYSIIQPSTGQLPRLACRCCRKKYHGTCLYKWFHSSGKSNCPHCQSPW